MLLQPNERWILRDTEPGHTAGTWFKNFVSYQDLNRNSVVAEYATPGALCDAFRNNTTFPDDAENNMHDAYRRRGLIHEGAYAKLHAPCNDGWLMGNHFGVMGEALTSLRTGQCHASLMRAYETAKEAIMQNSPDLRDLQSIAFAKRRRRVFADEGDELDIDRCMAGDPEQWQKKGYRNGAKRSARIFYSVPMTCGTNANQFAKSIAYLAAYSDIIESAGVACEIVAGVISSSTNTRHNYTCVSVKLKEADEPLDVSKLLCIGESFFLRMLVFNSYTSLSGTVNSFYGTMMEEPIEKREFFDFYTPDVYLRGANGFENDNQVRATVKEIKTIFNIQNSEQ